MKLIIILVKSILLSGIFFAISSDLKASEPRQIVLTWQGDTKTTMTITWRTDEPEARTYGMKLIEDTALDTTPDHTFQSIREELVAKGWQKAGYETPEDAFIALCIGVMNHTNRNSLFAYQFLLHNWNRYTGEIGFEEELLPDRNKWNRTYDGVRENTLFYSSDLSAFKQQVPLSKNNLLDHISVKTAESYTFPETSAWLHKVELTGLKPGTTYAVQIQNEDGLTDPFTFRTAPETKKEFTFIAGSDTQSQTQERKEMTAHAATLDPEFVLISGDLVLRGMAENEWDSWFDEWHDLMITDDGRRIPVLPALGNHDVRGWTMGDFETDAAFYANRFNLPHPGKYYALEYGSGLVLITLDSGHTSAFNEELDWFVDTGYYEGGPHRVRDSHDGRQKKWLERTLQNYQNHPWIFAQYHINGFPTSQRYWEKPRYGRPIMQEHWIPLFEKYGVDLVHEGHGHRLKRTHPVKNGSIDKNGVVYIGEGGWGTHMSAPDDLWFVADGGPEHHFWQITLDEGWNTLTGWPVKWIDGEAVQGNRFTLGKNRE